MNEGSRHDQKFSGDVEIQALHHLQRRQVLLGDGGDRNVADTDFILLDQMKQQVQRTFKDFQLDSRGHRPTASRTSAMVSEAFL